MKLKSYISWYKGKNKCITKSIYFIPNACLMFGYSHNRLCISWLIFGAYLEWKAKDPLLSEMESKLRKLKEEINSTDYSQNSCAFKEIKKQIEATEYKIFLLNEPLKEFK
jgi:hypothetical protein